MQHRSPQRSAIRLAALGFTLAGSLAHADVAWTQVYEALPPGSTVGQGYAVAIDGPMAVVGAPAEDVGTSVAQGAVYVYESVDGGWALSARLTVNAPGPNPEFGWSVAVEGQTIVVGAVRAFAPGPIGPNLNGEVFVLSKANGGWNQVAVLYAPDAGDSSMFGNAVAIHGSTILVGAWEHMGERGSAYVFVTDGGGSWEAQAELTGPDAGQAYFGAAVALGQDEALVSAPQESVGSNAGQGAVYDFVRTGSNWTLKARLVAPSVAPGEGLGQSVAFDATVALVGAPGRAFSRGGFYTVDLLSGAWALTDSSVLPGSNIHFGSAVALSPTHAVVGSQSAEAAVVYARDAGSWSVESILHASDGVAGAGFGWSVALSGDTALVGSPFHPLPDGRSKGTSYFFSRVDSGAADGGENGRSATGCGCDAFPTFATLALVASLGIFARSIREWGARTALRDD